MTHDLIGRVLEILGHQLSRVIINELKNSTFFALLELEANGEKKLVDCRPSDGIALAVQTGAALFVHEKVLEAVTSE